MLNEFVLMYCFKKNVTPKKIPSTQYGLEAKTFQVGVMKYNESVACFYVHSQALPFIYQKSYSDDSS